MVEKLKRMFFLLENKWWGIIFIYVLLFAATYSTIWAIIEPLDIRTKIEIFTTTIDRRFIHIIVTIIIASHLTLILNLIHRKKLFLYKKNSDVILAIDRVETFLSSLLYEIRFIVRPYRRENPLPLSELRKIWLKQPKNTIYESHFDSLLDRLRQKNLLSGLIFEKNSVFADEEYYAWRTTISNDDKKEIAKKSITFINSGDIIILDSGSTTIEIARQISQGLRIYEWENLTIVTNFFKAADEIIAAISETAIRGKMSKSRVYLVGGRIRQSTFALVGDDKITDDITLPNFNLIMDKLKEANLAFVGTNGICWEYGFSVTSECERNIKEAMLCCAKRKFIVSDPSKFGLKLENVFASFSQGIEIITTKTGDKHILDNYERWIKDTSTKIIYA